MVHSIDAQTEANHNRRMANQGRALDRADRLEAKIAKLNLIGELNSGKFYFFPAGGKYYEGNEQQVIDYIIRNGWVR